ncbi:MAG: hypothetical protein NVSMB46_03550 [Candidatus Saccharimonadales bacterium]
MSDFGPEQQEEVNDLSWTTHYAAMQMSDGSPSWREWRYHTEEVDIFLLRIYNEISAGGGYLSCAGIYKCDIERSAAQTNELAQLGRIAFEQAIETPTSEAKDV